MVSATSLSLGDAADLGALRPIRHALSVELVRLGLEQDCIEEAMVMVSELAANALEHAGGTARVSMSWNDRRVRVDVADDSDRVPERQEPDASRTGGRGMLIVDAFADEHGVDPLPTGGKVVWFAISRPPS